MKRSKKSVSLFCKHKQNRREITSVSFLFEANQKAEGRINRKDAKNRFVCFAITIALKQILFRCISLRNEKIRNIFEYVFLHVFMPTFM
jgi:hypothetical protein